MAEKFLKKGSGFLSLICRVLEKAMRLQTPWNINNYINWFEEFVKELNLGDFYLLGHSFGGALASKIAVKHAQEVKKLFLVSAACVRKKTAKKSFFKRFSKIVKIFYFMPYYGFFRKAVYKFIIRKSRLCLCGGNNEGNLFKCCFRRFVLSFAVY